MDIAVEIIRSMPSNLDELEQARYLYLELCRHVCFSTTFNNTDEATFNELCRKEVDVTNLDSTQVNCRMWSQLYSQLLDMVGIENEIINFGHQCVEFYANNKKWITDATYGSYTDLSRVKNNDDTIGFGLSFFQNIDKHSLIVVVDKNVKEILNDIDQKLGYNTDSKKNLMEFKTYLRDIKRGDIDISSFAHAGEFTEENEVCFKLEYLFSTVGKLSSGYYEQKDFIYNLENILLTPSEKEKVGAVELKKTNQDKTVDIVQCIYAYSGSKINYYLLAPNTEVQKYSGEQIIKLAMMGYGIEDKQIPGIIFPRKFRKGIVSKDYNYKLYNFLSSMKIISHDPIFSNIEESYKIK